MRFDEILFRKINIMRVLLCSPYKGVVGGMSKWTEHVMNNVSFFAREGIDLKVCPMGRSVLVNRQSKVVRMWYALKDYGVILNRYRKQIRDCRFDVVHICSSASWGLLRDLYMLRLAKKKGIKTVIHLHFGRIPELFQRKNGEWRRLVKVLRLADQVVVMDEKSYRELLANGYQHAVYVPNPLAPAVLEMAEVYKEERKERTLLFAGHVSESKGVFELVRACKNIVNVELVLMGKVRNEIKDKLYQLAETSKDGWLKIKGEQSFVEVIKAMRECGIFVLPSYTEGFPNVILESMACGCPIIATKVGAIPEMLDGADGGKCGLCVPPKDMEALREAILYFLEHADEAKKCGLRAKEKVKEYYSIERVCKQLSMVWQR